MGGKRGSGEDGSFTQRREPVVAVAAGDGRCDVMAAGVKTSPTRDWDIGRGRAQGDGVQGEEEEEEETEEEE